MFRSFVITALLSFSMATAGGAQSLDLAQDVGSIRFVSGPTGGTYFPLGEGVARAMNMHADGARVTSTPTGGSTENVRLISLGEADFGWAAADVVYFALRGEREFESPLENIRAISAGHTSVGHMVVRADSGIVSVAQMSGKSIAVGAAGSSNAQAAIQWLNSYGISEEDVTLQYISTSATADALRDNTVDAGFQLSGVPSATWQSLANDHPIRFLGIDQEQMAGLNERLPFYQSAIIPAGTYEGQDEAISTIGVTVILVTRNNVPEIQSYHMSRILIEHNDTLVESHPNGVAWDGRNVKGAEFVGIHSGAEQYYNTVGIDYQ
jgi:TRAP transporter TAXI family solute receptor